MEEMAANSAGVEVIDSVQTDTATVTDNMNQGAEKTVTPIAADNSDKKAKTKEYSERINQIRAEAQKKEDALNGQIAKYKQLEDVLKQSYKGESVDDLIYEITAQNEGISTEQARKIAQEKAKAEEERIKNHPAVKKAGEIIMQAQLDADLKAIKAAFPDLKADSVLELGDTYIALMSTGKVSAVAAYRASLEEANLNKKPSPPSTGDIQTAGDSEKTFYTKEEAERLLKSNKDVGPGIMEKIRKSMQKW